MFIFLVSSVKTVRHDLKTITVNMSIVKVGNRRKPKEHIRDSPSYDFEKEGSIYHS